MKTWLLLADDHSMVRNGLKATLAEHLPQAEFGFAESASSVLAQLEVRHWNLVVLDMDIPGNKAFDTLQDIKKQSSGTRVLVYTMHPEDQFGVRAIRSGADGFLSKDQPVEELLTAVNKLLSGRRYVSDNLLEALANTLSQPEDRKPLDLLSDREYHVLRCITRGDSMGRIAHDMNLSTKTVSTYRSRLLEKLGLQTTADLIRYGLKNKLAD